MMKALVSEPQPEMRPPALLSVDASAEREEVVLGPALATGVNLHALSRHLDVDVV